MNKPTDRHVKRSRRKQKRIYRFRPYKIIKIEPLIDRNFVIPLPRSGHRIIIFHGNLYAFGGYNPGNQSSAEGPESEVLFQELWQFNFASRIWKKLETKGKMPDELASHCAVLLNNNLLVFGGTGIPFGNSSSNSTHLCILDTLEWITLNTTGDHPLEQYGQAMAVYENKMYVVGGTNGYEYSIDVHCLDLITQEWERLRKEPDGAYLMPEPRYRHEIAIQDNELFVFGGGTSTNSFNFDSIPVFSLKECCWRIIKTSSPAPAARRCHGCVQMGSEVFISGGTNGFRLFSDIWRFSLKTFKWKKFRTELPRGVYFHSAALSEAGQMFIFGGVTHHVNKRTNEIFSMWLKIPSLSEICWQAVIHYIPHIGKLDKQTLFASGVPAYYLNQIEFISTSSSIGSLQGRIKTHRRLSSS